MKKLTFKHYIIIIFLLTLIGSCGSFFSQYVMGLKPCSLCIYQRLGVMATAFLALLCLPFSLLFMEHLSQTNCVTGNGVQTSCTEVLDEHDQRIA